MTCERPKSASLISVSESLKSIGFGDPPPILRQNNCVRNAFRVLSEQSKPIRDTITVVLYCSVHDRILLSKHKSGEIFFPFYCIQPGESPTETVVSVIERILKSFPKYFSIPKEIKLARLVRFPISDANRSSITLYTYFACVTHSPKFEDVPDPVVAKRGPLLCQSNGTYWNSEYECTYAWSQFTEFGAIRNSFWGPEVHEQAHQIRVFHMRLKDLNVEIIDYSISAVEQFFSDFNGQHSGLKDTRLFIRHSRITQKIFTALWNEWIFHCSPSNAMCYLSFKKFLYKLDIVPRNVCRKDLEEFDRIGRRLYHAFIMTGDRLKNMCRPTTQPNDIEITDLRFIQPKSSFPQLDFLSFVLGLAIIDSNCTSHLFWEIHMMFSFIYNAYKDEQFNQTMCEDDSLTMCQLRDMLYETPEILSSGIIGRLPQLDHTKSDCASRQKPSVDECASIIMRIVGKFDIVTEKSTLKLSDFRIAHDTADTEELIDLMSYLARAHYRLEQDGHILRRIETQMMIRQMDNIPGKWIESPDMDSNKIDDCFVPKNPVMDDRVKLARAIVTQNLERDKCEECSRTEYRINPKLTVMNRCGYATDFCPIEDSCLDLHKNANNNESLPALFIAPRGSMNANEMFVNVMSKKYDIKQVFRLAKNLLNEQVELIRHIDIPAVVIGEVRGNHQLLANICECVCPLFTHMTSVNVVTCGNYFHDDSGFEALLFLLSAKLYSPDRVVILKGRNDNREFVKETVCYKKHSETIDHETWNLLFDILDLLPLAAIIKDKIYVSSSGIPITSRKLPYISDFRRDLNKQNLNSVFYHQILHGQVVKTKSKLQRLKNSKLQQSVMKSKSSQELKQFKSQQSNSTLKSNSVASEITFDDVDKFLKKNDLTHFVRSDSWNPDDGLKCFKIQNDYQIITLGSLQPFRTNLCENGRLNGAFLMITKSTLQLIKLNDSLKKSVSQVLRTENNSKTRHNSRGSK